MSLYLLCTMLTFAQPPSSQPAGDNRPEHLSRYKLAELVLKPRIEDPTLFDSHAVECPMVLRWKENWVMYYTAIRLNDGKADSTIGRAVSDDLIHWRDRRQVLTRGPEGDFDHGGISGPFAWVENNRVHMIFIGFPRLGYETRPGLHGLATSEDGINFTRSEHNPIHGVGPQGTWNDDVVYKTFVMKHDGKHWMFYNAYGTLDQCEQIGLATSADLRLWSEHPGNPLLRKGEPVTDRDHRIIGDPWIMRHGNLWEMYYFAFDGEHARECMATSDDLLHWRKSPFNPIMDTGPEGSYDARHCHKPCIIDHAATRYHFYTAVGPLPGANRELRAIALATHRKLPAVKYREEHGR